MKAHACLLVLALAGLATPAFAGDAECDYLEISATAGKTPAVDPELKPLEKKLTHPPLSSWNTFHKLSGGHVTLERLKAQTLSLHEGRAAILLRDRKERRIDLTINIDDASGKRVLDSKQSVNAGEWNAWGHNVKDGGHILALTCK